MPILDGSSAPWCRVLRDTGLVAQEAPRRVLRLLAPVQVARYGGFLRAEPGPGFSVDVTHDVLPAFPVMRWRGGIDAARFDGEIARSRSFGNIHRRLGLAQRPVPRPPGETPNALDPALAEPAGVWEEIAGAAGDRLPAAARLAAVAGPSWWSAGTCGRRAASPTSRCATSRWT